MDILKESGHLVKVVDVKNRLCVFYRRDICMVTIEEHGENAIIEIKLYNGISMVFETATAPDIEKELGRWVKECK